MLARLDSRQGERNVCAGPGENENRVDIRPPDHLVVVLILLARAEQPHARRGALLVDVADRRDLDLRHLHEIRQIVGRGDHAAADNTDLDLFHSHPSNCASSRVYSMKFGHEMSGGTP